MTRWVEIMKLRRHFAQFARETEGIASLEFVLILFPMMIIFFGMIHWGILMYHYNEMENVARETVRRMAVDDDMNTDSAGVFVECPGVAGSAEAFACAGLGAQTVGADDVSACYQQDTLPPSPVFSAVVTIQAPMDAVGLIDVLGITTGRTLTSTADMRVEPGKIIPGGLVDTLCGGGAPVF